MLDITDRKHVEWELGRLRRLHAADPAWFRYAQWLLRTSRLRPGRTTPRSSSSMPVSPGRVRDILLSGVNGTGETGRWVIIHSGRWLNRSPHARPGGGPFQAGQPPDVRRRRTVSKMTRFRASVWGTSESQADRHGGPACEAFGASGGLVPSRVSRRGCPSSASRRFDLSNGPGRGR